MNPQDLRYHLPESNKIAYVTVGSTRGWCGHYHRSFETAHKCRESDSKSCSKFGGFTDRSIYVFNSGELLSPEIDWRYGDKEVERLREEASEWGDWGLVTAIDSHRNGNKAAYVVVTNSFAN